METRRLLMFLIGCIGTRLTLTLIAKNINTNKLPFIGWPAILIACSFFYIRIFGNEVADAQLNEYKEKKVWWNKIRPVHGYMYLIAGILAINKSMYTWIPFGIDVCFGLSAWFYHHYL